MMKIFKHKNIMGMIYGIVLAIPLLSILVRSAYVVVNKNAKESYSSIAQSQYIVVNDNNSKVDNLEYRVYMPAESLTTLTNNLKLGFNEISIDIQTLTGYSNVNILMYHSNGQILLYSNDTYLHGYSLSSDIGKAFLNTNIYFTMNANNTNYNNNFGYVYEMNIVFNKLDNAFDYSLSKYVDDNSFGKLNFFEWFFDIFMDSNQQNNLYIRFVNWYMNYVLLVSCSYILFLVLMWFVNYSRRLLERGLDYGW